jgi:hypothetical protein
MVITAQQPSGQLVGRARELAEFDQALNRVASGPPWTVELVGEPWDRQVAAHRPRPDGSLRSSDRETPGPEAVFSSVNGFHADFALRPRESEKVPP